MLKPKIRQFIQDKRELLENNQFEELYKLALEELYFSDDIQQLTNTLLIANIDPVNQGQLSSIPPSYLYGGNITEFIVPSHVHTIEETAFYGCLYLRYVDLSEVKNINWGAFERCMSLMHVDLPDGLKTIGDYAFAGTSITSVVIPKSVTLIRSTAFDKKVEYQVYRDSPMAKIAEAENIHPYKFID